jgi:hypothetical protein
MTSDLAHGRSLDYVHHIRTLGLARGKGQEMINEFGF